MKLITEATKNEILGKLKIQGYDCKSWATKNGYKRETVCKAINRYIGTGRKPKYARISKEILAKLEKELLAEE